MADEPQYSKAGVDIGQRDGYKTKLVSALNFCSSVTSGKLRPSAAARINIRSMFQW